MRRDTDLLVLWVVSVLCWLGICVILYGQSSTIQDLRWNVSYLKARVEIHEQVLAERHEKRKSPPGGVGH